jgi:SH3-like domain-containing protein
MIGRAAALLLILAGSLAVGAHAQPRRETPYWASIASGQAMMRAGPGRNYPGVWLYVRRDLPVRVVEVHESWRKVEDPGGAAGWMLVNLLSDARTAIVTGDEPRPMHERPDATSPLSFRAEPGVVGRLSRCAGAWCRLDVGSRGGFVRIEHIWGVDPDEGVD